MIDEWHDMMPDTVSVEPFSGVDQYGAYSYGTAVSYRARAQGRMRMITDVNGEQRMSQVTVYISGTGIGPQDRLTLPARFSPTQPSILSVQPVSDEHGTHHTVIYC